MLRCYLGLGSNLQHPQQQLQDAVNAIASLPDSNWSASSSLYQSQAIGPAGQPDYLNLVVAIDTSLPALSLLDQLQSIELDQGRVRNQRWGARTLDIDILLYGQEIINHPRLLVPHAEMHWRDFVLKPLAELSPELILPNGQALQNLLQTCIHTHLSSIADPLQPAE